MSEGSRAAPPLQDAPVPTVPSQGATPPESVSALQAKPAREIMYRHSVAVRLAHWVNALCLVLLLMSGLRIFNYHPALYFGKLRHDLVVAGLDPAISIGGSMFQKRGGPGQARP
jgi:hypothetical protein